MSTGAWSGCSCRWPSSATAGCVVPEKLTQQDIAERVGASRDMISRLMKDLVGGGYLAVEDRTIVILRKPPPGW